MKAVYASKVMIKAVKVMVNAIKTMVKAIKVMVEAITVMVSALRSVSYTHLRAHETCADLVCRLLLEKKKYKVKVNTFKKKAKS